jgi:hypothetical protein
MRASGQPDYLQVSPGFAKVSISKATPMSVLETTFCGNARA